MSDMPEEVGPPEWSTEDLLFISKCTSQYDATCRHFASELLAARAKLGTAEATIAEAERLAEQLAVSLATKWYPDANFKPLTGDLEGLISQIDNMTTGMARKGTEQQAATHAEQVAHLESALRTQREISDANFTSAGNFDRQIGQLQERVQTLTAERDALLKEAGCG